MPTLSDCSGPAAARRAVTMEEPAAKLERGRHHRAPEGAAMPDAGIPGPRGTPVAYLSYDRVADFVDAVAPRIRERRYAAAVGVLRGGAFPAVLASHAAGLPLAFLRYDRPTRTPAWDTPEALRPAPGAKLLLCEDIAGSGHTLADCRRLLAEQGYAVEILALAYDDLSRERPDFGIDLRGAQALFPWERHMLSPLWRTDPEGAARRLDHQFEAWGFDLDGVFLDDVPAETYRAGLDAALALRDTLPAATPPVPVPADALIVTARPRCDEARTRAWLGRHGWDHLRLEMRDEATPGALPAALHKARTCTRLGLTHFVESDPAQAIEIAAHAPWLRVLCWNTAERRARWVGAEPHPDRAAERTEDHA